MRFASIMRDRRVWLVLAGAAMFLVLRWLGLGAYLSLDALRDNQELLSRRVQDHQVLSAVVYMGTYAVAVAFSFPGAVLLTLAGGFLFGPALGTLFTVLGATLGASMIFLFAKSIFGAQALSRLGPPAARLAEGIRRDAGIYLLVMRLVPLFPFFLVNLVPAFVGVPFLTFVVTTFIGIIPGTAVYSIAGAGLGSVLEQGNTVTVRSVLTPEVIAGLVGLAVLALATIPLRRWLESRAGMPRG